MNKENKPMEDVTNKYLDMIHSFECDFSLAKNDGEYHIIENFKDLIIKKDERLLKHISLLEELCFNLRHGISKIMEDINYE